MKLQGVRMMIGQNRSQGTAGTGRLAGMRLRFALLLALAPLVLAAGAAGAEDGAASADGPPAAVTCVCDVNFDYADARHYRFWRREAVTAVMEARLALSDDVYQVEAGHETALCTDVREERRGDIFRSVDMCVHLGEWLLRIRQEMRCSLAADGATPARCRLPDPAASSASGSTPFLTATGQGEGAADSLCDAFGGAIRLRLAADIAAFEAERLHGLPDLQHHHACRPK